MTLNPVRLLQEGEPARQPSTLNRPVQDILFGSGYAPDGSDFEGFAKPGAVTIGGSFPTVQDFGALGDGLANDTAAFVSAGLSGRTIWIPKGIYKINLRVPMVTGTKFIGERGASVIQSDVTDILFYATGQNNLGIENLIIQGIMAWGIYILGGSGHRIMSNSVSGATRVYASGQGGICGEDVSDSIIDDNDCFGNGDGVIESNFDILLYAPTGFTINSCKVTNNRCRSTGLFINIAVYNGVRCTVFNNEATGAVVTTSLLALGSIRGGYGILLYNAGVASVSDQNSATFNWVHDVEGIGIYLARQRNSTASDNIVHDTGAVMSEASLPVASIVIDVSPGTNCHHNRIWNSNKHAIAITGDAGVGSNRSENTQVNHNIIDTTALDGVSIRGVPRDISILDNTIMKTQRYAIGSWSDLAAERIKASGNKIDGLGNPGNSQGIFAHNSTIDWTITDNEFTGFSDVTLCINDHGANNFKAGNRIAGSKVFFADVLQDRVILNGDATLAAPMIQFGSVNSPSTISGARGGGIALATNATPSPQIDLWTQNGAASPSLLWLVTLAGDVEIYQAAAGHAAGTFAAFWGAPTMAFKRVGGVKIAGLDVLGARQVGWTPQTAVASRADLGAAPTVGQIASWCAALQNDLTNGQKLLGP